MSEESGCCQSLSTCCSEASDSTSRAGKHGPHRRTRSRVHTQKKSQPGNRTRGEARTAFGTQETHERRRTRRTTTAPAKESTGLKFGWVKKNVPPPPPPLSLSVSLVTRSGGSRISAAAYRARTGGGSVQEAAPSTAVSISALSPLLRRVIVVALSRRVLATDPCWHSFFPASRDGIAAQLKRHGSRLEALIGRARRRLALKGAL